MHACFVWIFLKVSTTCLRTANGVCLSTGSPEHLLVADIRSPLIAWGLLKTFDMVQMYSRKFFYPIYWYILRISKYTPIHIFVCKKSPCSYTTMRIPWLFMYLMFFFFLFFVFYTLNLALNSSLLSRLEQYIFQHITNKYHTMELTSGIWSYWRSGDQIS